MWRFVSHLQLPGSSGRRRMRDWGLPPLGAGSCLARGLGTRQWAVRRERGSSTWVLRADGHLAWSQDFDTTDLLRDGAAGGPVVSTAAHKGSDVGLEQARALPATP